MAVAGLGPILFSATRLHYLDLTSAAAIREIRFSRQTNTQIKILTPE